MGAVFLAKLCLPIALTLLVSFGAGTSGAGSVPALIAHRGGAGQWPENTMLAFRSAQDQFERHLTEGWLELDTQFTSDEVLVVIHDATLDRTTDCTGAVVDRPAAEVVACDADPDPIAFEPVPRLEQVFIEGAEAGWRLVVEIKDIPGEPGFDPSCGKLATALAGLVEATGFAEDDLIVQSFWPPCLEQLQLAAPGIATLLLSSSTTLGDVLGLETPVGLGFTLLENALVSTLRGYEYSAPDDRAPDLNAVGVTVAHLLGRRVVVWTVNELERMQELAAMGVDGIISDRPDVLLLAFGL